MCCFIKVIDLVFSLKIPKKRDEMSFSVFHSTLFGWCDKTSVRLLIPLSGLCLLQKTKTSDNLSIRMFVVLFIYETLLPVVGRISTPNYLSWRWNVNNYNSSEMKLLSQLWTKSRIFLVKRCSLLSNIFIAANVVLKSSSKGVR